MPATEDRPEVTGARRVVVKVGSSSLTTAQGGAAHREVVIGRILERKGVHGPAAERTRRALLSAFELHMDPTPDSEAPRLFDLPFGPDSYRWALDEPVRQTTSF